jgi:hypothetical protein
MLICDLLCYKIIWSYQAFLLPNCLPVVATIQYKLHDVYDTSLSPFSALVARNKNSVRYYIAWVPGAFAKQLRKATLRFVVPVCSLICPNETMQAYTGRIFAKYLYIFTKICGPNSVYF